MAVRIVVQWRVEPSRAQEFNTIAADARKILERLGGRCRMFNALDAGPNTGLRSFVVEVENMTAYATLVDAMAGDSEWQTYLPRLFAPNAGWTGVSRSSLVEVPI